MRHESRSGAVLYAKDIDRVAAFYSAVLGLEEKARDRDHVVLESSAFQLVVLQIPTDIASTIVITMPPIRRALAAVKLVFFVSSMAQVRASVETLGGLMNPPDKEWSFQGFKVCDGLDPKGTSFNSANMPVSLTSCKPYFRFRVKADRETAGDISPDSISAYNAATTTRSLNDLWFPMLLTESGSYEFELQ